MLGVFDSGVGGLTVLRAIREHMPDLSMIYLGDSARTPYGDRSRETVTTYTKEACSFLFNQGCSLVVLACNTASAETLRELQQRWLPDLRKKKRSSPINVLGVIRPLAEEAAACTCTGRIGVVGTRSTVSSGAYIEELTHLLPSAQVIQRSCPLLVPLVEEGWVKKPETRKILRTYLAPLKAANPDVLVLGCTHYETLYPVFQLMMGRRCRVLHSPKVVAEKLEEYVSRHPEYVLPRNGKVRFLTTGEPERFKEVGSRFFGKRIGDTERVSLQPMLVL
jgi:glutamate racemase